MAGVINYFEHLYQRASKDTALLERNASDYPFSSLAGFLLLYHYKKIQHPGFEKLAKKIVLHFKNPLWMQFLLDQPLDENTGGPVNHSNYFVEKNTVGIEEKAEEITQTIFDHTGINEVDQVVPNKSHHNGLQQENETGNPAMVPVMNTEENAQKEFTASVDPGKPLSEEKEINFEPLHTVDYFASQGIKITEEPVANDKLGNQVKSFTAWLKSMKKLHASNMGEQNPATEKLIQNAAEESNLTTEVLTEAMAEVLVKQDKKEKAIEMYSKLSLINPSKSVYFAAKIERIKSS